MIIHINKYTYFVLLGIILQLFTINTFSQWIEWEKHSVFDTYENRSFSIKISNDGNILTCGDKYLGGYVYKANQNGDSLWTCLYATGYSITEDNNSNIYTIMDSTLFKISSNGNLIWRKELSDPMFDRVYFMKVMKCSDNNLLLSGGATLNTVRLGYLAKYDQNGNRIWSAFITDTSSYYFINYIVELSDGSILTCGDIHLSNSYRMFYAKFTSTGQLLFKKNFGENNNYRKTNNSAFELSNKDILNFSTLENGSHSYDLGITKFDSSGNLIFQNLFGNSNRSYLTWFGEGIIKDKFKNQYIVAGSKPTFSYDTNFCSLASYDSLGNLLWEKMTYSDSFPSFFNSIAQNNDSSYVVCGEAFKNFGSYSLSSPKYLHLLKTKKINPIGINTISSEIPIRFTLHQNYPNPFNPTTKIKFELPKTSDIVFTVYDILGRRVYSEYHNKTAGTYEIDFDASGFASGIYFYSVKAGDYSETRKMILLK